MGYGSDKKNQIKIMINMLRTFVYKLLNKSAKKLKGQAYQIDPCISLTAILAIGLRRLSGFTRSIIRGESWRKKVFFGRNVDLRSRKLIHIGRGVTLGKEVLIDGLSNEGVHLGDHVNIGDFSRIEASGTITKLGVGVRIGSNSSVGSFSFIGGAGGVLIGDDVIMGQFVSFHPANHNFDQVDISIRAQGFSQQGIVVEDDCWIGAKVTFLDGAHVGKGCVIAAGAVVRGVIPPYSIAGGIPAKVIKSRLESTAS